MSQPYLVKASSPTATYRAGTFEADSPEEACDQARERYAQSNAGRAMGDVGAFRFYVSFDSRDRDPWQPLVESEG